MMQTVNERLRDESIAHAVWIRTLYRVLLQAQVHTHILSVLVLIRTPLRLVHMDTPSPLTLLVTRKTPSKTSHLTIL